MKQLLQSLQSGELTIESVPSPQPKDGELLIQAHCSLISAGTERMLLAFGKANLLGKIKQQPDKVKQVIDKVKTNGLLSTLDAVKSKLDQPLPLGYCHVGRVLDAGNSQLFKAGDRVLSNGPHAEIVRVPHQLCAKIPDEVDDESAVFTILGAIALQGIRLLKPTLGECIVVQGLGLIGLIAVQLLIAQGCRVLGVDVDAEKLALARKFGAETVNLSVGENLISRAEIFSRGRGVDGVLITASAKTDEIVHQAATISRQRGRIILVGVVGLNLRRDDFYKKELTFQVSCSYGPGRYDDAYEKQGHDYPIAYVRWTEQRNFEAILDMLAAKKLDMKPLINQRFALEDAVLAYEALEDKRNLGILLKYAQSEQSPLKHCVTLAQDHPVVMPAGVRLAFLGAGNYASRVLMPAFKKTSAICDTVVTNQGVSAVTYGKKLGFLKASTDVNSVLLDDKINAFIVATQHHLHAKQVIAALRAGKHVFVEKPLCLSQEELSDIENVYQAQQALGRKLLLMVGFNRRFSPHIQAIKSLISPMVSPKNFVMTVNAGYIPVTHWTQDPSLGGGRLLGEACHFVDLLRFLAGSQIIQSDISWLDHLPEGSPKDENVMIFLRFADGSQGSIHYFANGHASFPKERLEVFVDGKIIQLDNFRKMRTYGFSGMKKMNFWRQDKGQLACATAFVQAIEQGSASPIAFEEMIEVMQVCLELRKRIIYSSVSSS